MTETGIDHRALIRETENASAAVLLIHGIAGTPAHFQDLLSVIPQSMSVYNILLDGHGGTPKDFSATSMEKWETQVDQALTRLFETHRRVFIVAHSMGTLFAIRAATAYPDKIAGLFLLAVPLRPWVRFSTLRTGLRVVQGKQDPQAQAMRNDSSIQISGPLWQYLGWIPRLWELLLLIQRTKKCLPALKTPTMSFQSKVDELVATRSIGDLDAHPVIQNTVLYDSGHFAYGEKDMALLRKRLKILLQLPQKEI